MHNIYTKILAGIHKFFKETQVEKAVIGVSGGVDSALALKLLVDSLGEDKVTAVLMPEKGVSMEENLQHAKGLCQFLKVEYFLVPINKHLMDFLALPWKPSNLAQMNTKARVRMTILYSFANTRNALVVGASNKTELSLGYGTKQGDLGVDIQILGDLFKEEVFALADHVGLPNEFLEKTPSAELFVGQTDEEELGMTYKEMDTILAKIEEGMSKDDLINKGLTPHAVHKIFRMREINNHKLLPPFIIKSK